MQSTTNYSMNLVEGTDLVNIPVQLNPNFQTIDSEMFKNKQASTGTATEVVTGTVHAIVRANPDSDVFRFTATGAWTAGDTMTLDGSAVTVHLSDGTAPATGAYIIGAEVLAVVNGTLVTLITSAAQPVAGVTSFNSRTGAVVPQASDYDAADIDYDNTLSGLTSTDCQSAIDELAGSLGGTGLTQLWVNPDDTVAYSASSFTDTTDKTFKAFITIFKYAKNTSRSLCAAAKIGDRSSMFNFELLSNGSIMQVMRDVQVSQVGAALTFTIGDCYYYIKNSWTAPTSSYNNDYMIPAMIFGIE